MTWPNTDLKGAMPAVFARISHQSLRFSKDLKCAFVSISGNNNVFALNDDQMIGKHIDDFPISEVSKQHFKSVCESLDSKNTAKRIVLNETNDDFEHWLIRVSGNSEDYLELHAIANESGKILKNSYDDLFRYRKEHVLVVNKNAEIQYLNRCFLGWPVSTSMGRNVASLFPADEKQGFLDEILKVHETKNESQIELSVPFLQQVHYYIADIQPMANEEGSVLIELFDQTKEKKRSLDSEEKALLFETVLDGMDHAVFAANAQGEILFQNSAIQKFFGRRFNGLIEFTHATAGHWLKNDNKTPINLFDLPFTQEFDEIDPAVEFEFFYEVNEKEVPFEISCSKVQFTAGAELAVWQFRNIYDAFSARKRMEEANASLDDFVRATAHDLRSPISNMKNLFNLLDKVEDESKKNFVLEKVCDSVFKLDELLNGLMQMVDAQNNQHLMIEQLDFQQVLNFVCNDLEDRIEESGANIKASFEVDKVVYNKAYLRSILHNLISNAIKYRDQNKPLEITVSNRKNNNEIWLRVEDNGMGIDLEKHGKLLFQPFKRLTNVGSGKGIGLSLIKQFVEKNGGQIFVDSEVGVGTTFVCVLNPFSASILQPSLF